MIVKSLSAEEKNEHLHKTFCYKNKQNQCNDTKTKLMNVNKTSFFHNRNALFANDSHTHTHLGNNTNISERQKSKVFQINVTNSTIYYIT
jgi:hypothetical protein